MFIAQGICSTSVLEKSWCQRYTAWNSVSKLYILIEMVSSVSGNWSARCSDPQTWIWKSTFAYLDFSGSKYKGINISLHLVMQISKRIHREIFLMIRKISIQILYTISLNSDKLVYCQKSFGDAEKGDHICVSWRILETKFSRNFETKVWISFVQKNWIYWGKIYTISIDTRKRERQREGKSLKTKGEGERKIEW